MSISLLAAAASGQSTDNTVAIVAIIATAVGALGAAIVAAVAAGRRQKRELRHDRQLGDVAEARNLIDVSLRGASKTEDLFRHVHIGGYDENVNIRQEISNAMDEMYESRDRLVVRFGRDHEITQAYMHLTSSLTQLSQWMASDESDEQGLDDARKPFINAYRDYTDVTNRYLASDLPTSDLPKRRRK